jgi:hypothetical protein
MPHDVKGRKIERGDFIKLKIFGCSGGMTIAQVSSVNEAATHCNVTASHMMPGVTVYGTFNAGETELVMKADGSDPADVPLAGPVSPGPEAQRDGSPA